MNDRFADLDHDGAYIFHDITPPPILSGRGTRRTPTARNESDKNPSKGSANVVRASGRGPSRIRTSPAFGPPRGPSEGRASLGRPCSRSPPTSRHSGEPLEGRLLHEDGLAFPHDLVFELDDEP